MRTMSQVGQEAIRDRITLLTAAKKMKSSSVCVCSGPGVWVKNIQKEMMPETITTSSDRVPHTLSLLCLPNSLTQHWDPKTSLIPKTSVFQFSSPQALKHPILEKLPFPSLMHPLTQIFLNVQNLSFFLNWHYSEQKCIRWSSEGKKKNLKKHIQEQAGGSKQETGKIVK